MNFSNFELLQMQTDALFVYDARQRMVSINEPEADNPAPRFFLGRSLAGNLWRIRYDLPDDLSNELERLAASEPVVSDLRESPYHQMTYMELLAAHAPISGTSAGPAYYLPKFDLPNRALLVTDANRGLVQTHFPWLYSHLEGYSPAAVMVDDGVAVTACSSVRLTPQAAEAGLYTLESYRGGGYAADTVRCWAEAVRATGRIPLYSTSWENNASQAVARKLGAVQYGADFNIT
jgi:GNAT acetyltransferase-like protein